MGRSNRDRIARVHPHRVEVLDRADNHAVVGVVAHDLKFVFFPALDAALDQDLIDRAGVNTASSHQLELFWGVGERGALTAQDVGRPDDDGQTHLFHHHSGLFHGVGNTGLRAVQADLGHGLAEQVAVLGGLDG